MSPFAGMDQYDAGRCATRAPACDPIMRGTHRFVSGSHPAAWPEFIVRISRCHRPFSSGTCLRHAVKLFEDSHEVLCGRRIARVSAQHETGYAVAIVMFLALVRQVDALVARGVADDSHRILALLHPLDFAPQHAPVDRKTLIR